MKSFSVSLLSLILIVAGLAGGPLYGKTPQLVYSTYLGGTSDDSGYGIAVFAGCAYVTGYTGSSDFPTINPYQSSNVGDNDVFVAKLSTSGSELIFATYLGGSGNETGKGIAVAAFQAYVTGFTTSTDFPTENAYQTTNAGGYDAFVAKFSSSGTDLEYSTYLGGCGEDQGTAIDLINTAGYAYLTGFTASADFPTANAYQISLAGTDDAFVAKFSSSGSDLLYSTYVGGCSTDKGYDISLDIAGAAYIVGATTSTNFPTIRAYQGALKGAADAFICKFSSGTDLYYSTYLGGETNDIAYGIFLSFNASVTGVTASTNFPTQNPYQIANAGGDDAFVATLTGNGGLIYSTYLGGSGNDYGRGLCLCPDGYPFITGFTASTDFPTVDPYQSTLHTANDVFFARIFLDDLDYSTYFGGDGDDRGYGILVEPLEGISYSVHGVGMTASNDFPTKNPYQSSRSANDDAFVCKLTFIPTPTITPTGYKTVTPTPTPPPTPPPTPTPPPKKRRGYKLATPFTMPTEPPPTTPPAAPEPTPAPIEELLLADPGDYDGDGTVEPAVFRPASGLWSVRDYTRLYFGRPNTGDLPTSGDYDGDGTADIAIFRPTSGLWSIRLVSRIYYGGAGDSLIPGDYNGDGICDIAVFRSATGLWAVQGLTKLYFGTQSDQPISGDYDGDGTADIGIFRSSAGLWKIKDITLFYLGTEGDIAVPGDYDGSGLWTAGIFRPASGLWAIREITRLYFGAEGDQLLPGDYDGDLVDDIAIFRPTSGLWAVKGITRLYLGP